MAKAYGIVIENHWLTNIKNKKKCPRCKVSLARQHKVHCLDS